MADFFGNYNFGDSLKNLFVKSNGNKTLGPNPANLTTEKPGPNTFHDPNIAVNDSQQSGTDINNDSDPVNGVFAQFDNLNEAINKSLMQQGNGWFNFDATRWSKNFYYRFVILRAPDQRVTQFNQNAQDRDSGYTPLASFKLPINPQTITVDTPYASTLTITSDGAFEEHNGTPIKMISVSGTTGILPNRTAVGQIDTPLTPFGQLASAVAPNTVRVVSQTIQSASSVVDSFNQLIGNTAGTQKNPTEALLSGYGQFQLMRLFLDGYALLKTLPGGEKYRLAFHMPKDNTTYLVKLDNFPYTRSVDSPMEYRYTINMTAWATINLSGNKVKDQNSIANKFNILKGNILNTLIATRKTIAQYNTILQAIKTDYQQTVVGPINLAVLTLKEVVGVAKSIVDYGGEQGNLSKALMATMITNAPNNPQLSDQVKKDIAVSRQNIVDSKNNSENAVITSPIVGGSGGAVGSSVPASSSQGININSFTAYQVADGTPVASIPLTSGQTQLINSFEDQARRLRRKDYEQMISNLNDLSDAIEASGMDDSKYEIQYALNDAKTGLYGLISTDQYDDNRTLNALQYWQAKANSSGIDFNQPNSKFSIPFPFGTTLEWIAESYLNDATRWLEIAALNNLQPPYVDEDGFFRNFLSNGSGSTFNVSDGSNLYVGQSVILSSSTQRPTTRSIVAIQQISQTNFLILVDGTNNLSSFTVADGAKMHAYLPYTTNSSQRIFIPSDAAPTLNPDNTKPIPYLIDNPDLIQFSKIDWLIDANGDLAVSSDGFQNLAVGAANLVQAARLKIDTVVNTLLLHRGFGTTLEIGDVTANFNANDLRTQLNNMFTSDTRFSGINRLSAQINNGTVRINADAGVTFNNGSLPISIELK